MIVTLCRACDTVTEAIIDRCKYCGSTQIGVEDIEVTSIGRIDSRRYILIREKKDRVKKDGRRETHS
jgi:uncharacterized OB-fold protein